MVLYFPGFKALLTKDATMPSLDWTRIKQMFDKIGVNHLCFTVAFENKFIDHIFVSFDHR
jgi:hypothetical protein